ncbi:MAG: DNA-binding protein [Chloroflexi bacterium]|nr:DNA-binding protein [Chloroflexota bacterium]MBV9546049.1 DNA-binding protein [Chloroflexota bacterium]
MKTRLLDQTAGTRTFVIIFDKDDEAKDGLTQFATEHNVTAAHLTAVGGFSRAVLGYFSRDKKEYERIPVDEQVEVLSLVGDVAVKPDGKPEVHAHVVVGRRDGSTRGGHLLEASVWPTLEVVVTDSPEYLRKTPDPETGLAVINPEA